MPDVLMLQETNLVRLMTIFLKVCGGDDVFEWICRNLDGSSGGHLDLYGGREFSNVITNLKLRVLLE